MNLCPPPANSEEEKSPVMKEFRWLTFERVADELEDPPDHEQD